MNTTMTDVLLDSSTAIETPLVSPAPSSLDNKPSLGEELFLVHLNRFDQEERNPEDFDREHEVWSGILCRRERSLSRGEELWHVHCKRKEQSEPDYDEDVNNTDDDDDDAAAAPVTTTTTTTTTTTRPKSTRGAKKKIGTASIKRKNKVVRPRAVSSRILHLRNRDVEISKEA